MRSCFKKVLVFIVAISSCFLSFSGTAFAAEAQSLKGVVIDIDAGHQGKENSQKKPVAEPAPETPATQPLNEAAFWTNLYTLPNYDKQLLESYCQQHVAQPQMSADDLVKEVNVGTYRPFYTDPQTIQDPNAIDVMVNKYNMLPDGFVPQLADVPSKYGSGQKMHPEAVEHLVQFFDAASANGINMRAASAYRSFQRQTTLYKNYSARDGQVGADTYSARPGFSEHQTGLAVDVSLAGGSYSNIGSSPQYPWIRDNAHLYGFIVRYTVSGQAITGYQSEPWHIRYLGVDLATKVYQSGLTYEEYAATADKRTAAPMGE